MIIFEAYKYLYYRIYSFQLRCFGEDDLPEYTAVLGVSFLISLNIYAVLLAITEWTRFKVIDSLNTDKIQLGLGLLFIIGINSSIFLRKKYYEQIPEQFKNESNFERRIKLIFIFAYVIFSFVIPFIF